MEESQQPIVKKPLNVQTKLCIAWSIIMACFTIINMILGFQFNIDMLPMFTNDQEIIVLFILWIIGLLGFYLTRENA
jgi:hypothetical protein